MTGGVGEASARLLVNAVGAVRARRAAASAVSLVVTLVIGVGYLTFGALGMNPAASTYRVRVHLADSGGLLTGRTVALRGVPVGTVESVELTGTGLVAVAVINADTALPADGEVRVASLSLAGEQYLDFRPTGDDGPYLADGAEIAVERTSTPTPLWQTLSQMDSTLAQVDPAQLAAVVDGFGVGPQGPEKLADLIDGGIFLISTLDAVLPQTVSLLRDSKQVLGTMRDFAPGLGEFATGMNQVLAGVSAKSGGYAALLDATPGTLRALDAVLAQNADRGTKLLDNLGVVADITGARVPAFQEFFFPTERGGSTLDAIAVAFHDGGVWGLVNLYPRYSCDYDLPRRSPSLPDFPEPYRYTYCPNTDPSVLIRGAANAPRPPGAAIPGLPPPGEPAVRQTIQTPVGPLSLPLTFAGPPLPDPPPAPHR
ncbi:MlaD family protein [Nocardia rhizosphaerihabitans]|uniref:Mce family protein n=1 Tax=Nocardia rhizosphaerihabitans TaxID=1691570 RepID=A0ABQ2KYR6_9NOCA|nr:MlaD family protein [Nocardia rhizosphaerihabitans]GGN97287.1 putative Mce family protein [Nocardia rhizosphaerihabitans]